MNTLANKQVQEALKQLHKLAEENRQFMARPGSLKELPVMPSWNIAYMAVEPDLGNLLYFLSSMIKAKTIVEFGCSYGISTIYLAAAAKDNAGRVITTEMEAEKIPLAKTNFALAGLQQYIDLRHGDAVVTLAQIDQPVDFLFLDGTKKLYLPILQLLMDKLHVGSVIVADNTDNPNTRNFTDFITNNPHKFTYVWLFQQRVLVVYVK